MSDLIERLRASARLGDVRLPDEAADEIERLFTDRQGLVYALNRGESFRLEDEALLRQALENLEGAAPRNGLWEPYADVIAALRERLGEKP